MLDRAARTRLRTLGKNNAELVARHLVMAGRLIDDEPETAYGHAQAAMRRAGRVDVVREALALTAYATGRYSEALRELRTVRRLSGIDAHRAMEADCERGLGRPERALTVVAETDPGTLSEEDRVELAIVASGARSDLGEHEAGLLVLESRLVDHVKDPELLRRLTLVRADRLEELGRMDEADAARAAAGPEMDDDEPIVVVDLEASEAEAEDEDFAEPTDDVATTDAEPLTDLPADEDAAADEAADVEPDAAADEAADVEPDAAADVEPDAAADVEPDAAADEAPAAPTDETPDAGAEQPTASETEQPAPGAEETADEERA
ncbi:hypothetical protein FE374_06905 [Georgenia yuyongxinii]|uniref:Tetratricopeptide repeat protein n=2 Tax=Georgenia yuyongxinii TaxID=2589797 RepID=A0A5B8C2T1_9MICO|nr:hypothetical protein [Georgenia yuyongxinii]QDC24390.1 hypothetical protein FE374_06905 [Georgenia yuyongxinii]